MQNLAPLIQNSAIYVLDINTVIVRVVGSRSLLSFVVICSVDSVYIDSRRCPKPCLLLCEELVHSRRCFSALWLPQVTTHSLILLCWSFIRL